MDHGHGDMDMCKMNMLFNWDVENVCIVFEWWRIKSPFGLLLSCFIIAGIAAGYEFLRHASREYDDEIIAANKKKDTSRRLEDDHAENDGLLSTSASALTSISQQQKVIRSIIYAILVGISFWLMLVFMTYNGFLMVSVVIGAGLGHYAFGGNLPTDRGIQCH
ncbi:Ctr copper transporter [Umbelopsis sp. AD052]|nr:Ctr copper transporter [Umbelopsis sp. AD052]